VQTSPTASLSLAAASALILSAYQNRHRLPAEEAERLSLSIAETLAALNRAPAAATTVVKAVPHKRARRIKRETPPEPAAESIEPLVAAPLSVELETQVIPPVEILMAEAPLEAGPEDDSESEQAYTQAPTEGRAKRKRPSRPRSRRGNREGSGHV
jgi:hypothetical protein